jgi:hypothetical protein
MQTCKCEAGTVTKWRERAFASRHNLRPAAFLLADGFLAFCWPALAGMPFAPQVVRLGLIDVFVLVVPIGALFPNGIATKHMGRRGSFFIIILCPHGISLPVVQPDPSCRPEGR